MTRNISIAAHDLPDEHWKALQEAVDKAVAVARNDSGNPTAVTGNVYDSHASPSNRDL